MTIEPQYEALIEHDRRYGRTKLGLMANQAWGDDPKRLAFTLARYGFAAKMLPARAKVLEIGCGDGFGTKVLRQAAAHVVAVDFDPIFIEDAIANGSMKWPVEFVAHDMLTGPIVRHDLFDAVVSLDVLEHIAPHVEDVFLSNAVKTLTPSGVAIIGMPSLESQVYASEQSKAGHCNCKRGSELETTMLRHFANVFSFSMNDSAIFPGHSPMAHYRLVVASGPKG